MTVDLQHILLANLILIIAGTIHGIIGFGLALMTAPLLNLINPIFVPVPLVHCGAVLAVLIWYSERRNFAPSAVFWPICGSALGGVVAAFVLVVISALYFQLLFGILVLLAVMLSLLKDTRLPHNPHNGALVGLLSGFMGVSAAIPGPPMALYYQHMPPEQFRANMAGFFLVSALVALAALYLSGKWQLQHSLVFLAIFPGLMVGFICSRLAISRFKLPNLRQPVLLFVGAVALVTLYQAINAILSPHT